MNKIINVTNHPVDLADGRTLAPGEEASGVSAKNPHNQALIAQGSILVVEEAKATKASATNTEEEKSS